MLYTENGSRAAFWAREMYSQKGLTYFIKAVGGKVEGPLQGIPDQYGGVPVAADLYLGSTRLEADINISDAYQPVFYRTEAPSELGTG